jgi:hypothetical protein
MLNLFFILAAAQAAWDEARIETVVGFALYQSRIATVTTYMGPFEGLEWMREASNKDVAWTAAILSKWMSDRTLSELTRRKLLSQLRSLEEDKKRWKEKYVLFRDKLHEILPPNFFNFLGIAKPWTCAFSERAIMITFHDSVLLSFLLRIPDMAGRRYNMMDELAWTSTRLLATACHEFLETPENSESLRINVAKRVLGLMKRNYSPEKTDTIEEIGWLFDFFLQRRTDPTEAQALSDSNDAVRRAVQQINNSLKKN